MDIYKILNEDRDSIIDEDLEFFEIELAVGNYEKEYISRCLKIISEIKHFRKSNRYKPNSNKVNIDVANEANLDNVNFKKEANNAGRETLELREEKIKRDIVNLRNSGHYQIKFSEYVKKNKLTEEFIDKNYTFFKAVEIDELLTTCKFSENFLEKYFNLLNKNIISQHQNFSEEFFIKYIKELNYKLVLTKGVNPWIKKENRSSKLTVFLKLKGINL